MKKVRIIHLSTDWMQDKGLQDTWGVIKAYLVLIWASRARRSLNTTLWKTKYANKSKN